MVLKREGSALFEWGHKFIMSGARVHLPDVKMYVGADRQVDNELDRGSVLFKYEFYTCFPIMLL